MIESFRHFFSADGFMPHGHCYLWQPGVLWLHILSDALIVCAYFSIPFTLLYFVRKRRDLEFNWMYVCFAVFIVACGTTHFMEIWTIWHPTYWLAGAVKAITALASVPTAILLVKLVPTALRLPGTSTLQKMNVELQREITDRKRAENDAHLLNRDLESRVADRTVQLEVMNRNLQQEVRDRQRAEESVRASQRLLQAVISNTPAVVYVKDEQGRYLLANPRFEELFHLDRGAILGKTDYDIFPKENADAYRAIDLQVLKGPGPQQMEEVAPLDDGLHTYVSVKCPLHDESGKAYAVCGISTDITETKQSEQRQRQQLGQLELLNRITRAVGERQDLRSIFQVVIRSLEEDLPIDFGCFCLYDDTANSLTVAHVGARSSALAAELALTERTRIAIDSDLSRCLGGELIYEPDLGVLRLPISQALSRGGLGSLVMAPLSVEESVFGVLFAGRRATTGFSGSECEFLRQLSEHVSLAAHQAKVYSALQIAYDDMRQAQRAIMQQERLRALGQIASGIAHDINNAISPITLYTEMLLEHEPNLSARARDQITTIQLAIEDVAQTVARMREFYRQREPERALTLIDLNRIVKEVIDLTRPRWKDVPQQKGFVIDLQTDLSADLPGTAGAENEIRDALTNLIFNAVDAMPEGGALTMRTRTTQSGDKSIRYACVEICDTGVGMDDETRRRCLEPFFTTKGERGTGLGLAMVYGMVQRHSAELQIDSEPGRGTTMRLVFPAAALVAVPAVDLPKVHAKPHSLRILIVDDDPMLIRSLKDTLEMDGHVVVAANGGQAGIDAFLAARESSEPFALVITDLGMPHVDGRKVATAVRAVSAAMPIILLTGWGQQLLADNEVPPQVDRVLSKPPKLHELRAAIAELGSR